MDFLNELKNLKKQVFFEEKLEIPRNYDKIVIAGMGGSGIAGKIFQEMYTDKPVFALDDYHIPEFADEKTMFVAMSYSGNTEEVIAATREAIQRGCSVSALTSGGELESIVENVIKVPSGLQPRSSLGYMLMPLINSFLKVGSEAIRKAGDLLDDLDSRNEWIKDEAEKIFERELIPVVYGFSPYRSIAYRWKTQFNENAKVMAFSNYFPELDHNEIIPLKQTYRKDQFRFYTFGCSTDNRITKRIHATGRVSGIELEHVETPGESLVEKMFYLIHYGDYLTYHLANLRKIDPMDVSAIEDLKKILKG